MVNLYSKFKETNTYQAYSMNNVFKCNSSNIKEVLTRILQEKSNQRVLIEIQSSSILNDDIINLIFDDKKLVK